MTWTDRFMALAEHVSTWSKDRSTKVGAVLVDPKSKAVLSLGYNGFPRGCDDTVEHRHARPLKYAWTEHAERNAIFNAARNGVRTEGATMYLPWFPCVDCARAIIQAGVAELVCVEPDLKDPRWGEGFAVAIEMLHEAGVEVMLQIP